MELIFIDAEEVKRAIELENPDLNVQILRRGAFVTRDYRHNRVRIFTDENNKVVQVPHIG